MRIQPELYLSEKESCSSVDSEEFEPEALVDSGVALRQDNFEVKTGLEEARRGWFNSGVDSLGQKLEQVYEVDFVILCVGRFSRVPNIPEFPPGKGPQGRSYTPWTMLPWIIRLLKNWSEESCVTVVGLQKLALDITMEYSTANGEN
ncbi:hypothetical protein HYC85_025928 [Camellia sinensis]|uniref:Flavin-containing monooxygenase n=1 Tax=Camellia sinensis TaxID=4442 RepID=A0A7J7G295_CAMSI|nr:hypothetical protein HYC85_025928 [Camellia sinensis]